MASHAGNCCSSSRLDDPEEDYQEAQDALEEMAEQEEEEQELEEVEDLLEYYLQVRAGLGGRCNGKARRQAQSPAGLET